MDQPHETTAFLRTLARAETATAREAWDEAAALWARVVAANPVEGRFWTRLADARCETKDYRGAVEASERALELRDGFPAETAYRIARCFALLQEQERALSWLERAWDLGYRYLERARGDDDLASLRGDARFRDLVALVDTADLPREEGWRADLCLLAREVKRRAYAPFRDVSEDRFDAAVAVSACANVRRNAVVSPGCATLDGPLSSADDDPPVSTILARPRLPRCRRANRADTRARPVPGGGPTRFRPGRACRRCW